MSAVSPDFSPALLLNYRVDLSSVIGKTAYAAPLVEVPTPPVPVGVATATYEAITSSTMDADLLVQFRARKHLARSP